MVQCDGWILDILLCLYCTVPVTYSTVQYLVPGFTVLWICLGPFLVNSRLVKCDVCLPLQIPLQKMPNIMGAFRMYRFNCCTVYRTWSLLMLVSVFCFLKLKFTVEDCTYTVQGSLADQEKSLGRCGGLSKGFSLKRESHHLKEALDDKEPTMSRRFFVIFACIICQIRIPLDS